MPLPNAAVLDPSVDCAWAYKHMVGKTANRLLYPSFVQLKVRSILDK